MRVSIDRGRERGWLGRCARIVGVLIVVALCFGGLPPVQAQTSPEAAIARGALERQCAGCHHEGRLQGRTVPDGALGNILDLDALSREPHLVVPGNPDGSRLYHRMLGHDVPGTSRAGRIEGAPTAAELRAVRTWIARLDPAQRPGCAARKIRTLADELEMVGADRGSLPAARRDHARYVSLGALWNACEPEPLLRAAGHAMSMLFAAASNAQRAVAAAWVGQEPMLLRIDLAALEWSAADWERLAAVYPYAVDITGRAGARQPVILRADWLAFAARQAGSKPQGTHVKPPIDTAFRALSQGEGGLGALARTDRPAFERELARAGIDVRAAWHGTPMLEALAHRYAADLDAARVAAELGLEAARLPETLELGSQAARDMKTRLAAGTVSRRLLEADFGDAVATVEGLRTDRSARRDVLGVALTAGSRPPRLDIVVEKERYAPGELVAMKVESELDCNLTLVNVAPSGEATVLLPNDWDTSISLPANTVLTFPRKDAAFRFRASAIGWETIVAGCNPTGESFDGIRHDFNLQKFTRLGPYEAFLDRRQQPEAKTEDRSRRERRGRRFRRAASKPSEVKPASPVLRAAVRFEVR